MATLESTGVKKLIYGSKFFKCVNCDTLVEALNPQCCDDLVCCGRPMQMLKINADAALEEKHIPVIKRENDCITVCVGRVLHPMCSEHSILWVELKGKYICYRVNLKKGDDPIVTFREIGSERSYIVYAYCSIHGLWCAEI
jgi:superoxide reductase